MDVKEPSVTIVTCPGEDPDHFERLTLRARREKSAGWKKLPFRSEWALDTVFTKAAKVDFFVFDSSELLDDDDGWKVKTRMMTREGVLIILPGLEELIEGNPAKTVERLAEYRQGPANEGAIRHALTKGEWPTTGDYVEEAAAFGHHLLEYARLAKTHLRAVCWEYRSKRLL